MAEQEPRWPVVSDDNAADAAAEPPELGEISCPACGGELGGAALFETYRVCPGCARHFPLPARERLALLLDPGSFAETNATLVSVDPLRFRDPLPYPDRVAVSRARPGLTDAVITGSGAIGGREVMLVLLDFAYLGGSIGVVAGEKIALAMEQAASYRLPLLAVCSGGGARVPHGVLALAQIGKTASAAARLRREGIPIVSLLTHPTTGGVYVGLANQADIVLAEPGAQIGVAGVRGHAVDAAPNATYTAEVLLDHGMVDAVVPRDRQRDMLGTLLDLLARRATPHPVAPPPAGDVSAVVPAWEAVSLARDPARPTARDYIARLLPEFVELHGDRATGDDPAVMCGLGRFAGTTVAVVAQEREQARAAGYRKAARVMRLAGHFELPLLTFVDAPGDAADDAADAAGIGVALARAFEQMSSLPVPIVSALIGEGGSAGALALGSGDRMLMQEHAIYAIAGAEGAGPDLAVPGAPLMLTARDCQRLGIVDAIVPEPVPAAHADPGAAAELLGAALAWALAELTQSAPRRLLDERARRVRTVGQMTPEGRAATRREVRELIELQRTLARSLGDLRARWEARNPALPHLNLNLNLNLNLRRPDLAEITDRLPHRADLADFAGRIQRPDLADLAGRLASRRSSGGPEEGAGAAEDEGD